VLLPSYTIDVTVPEGEARSFVAALQTIARQHKFTTEFTEIGGTSSTIALQIFRPGMMITVVNPFNIGDFVVSLYEPGTSPAAANKQLVLAMLMEAQERIPRLRFHEEPVPRDHI
jgi:hypothetical protein